MKLDKRLLVPTLALIAFLGLLGTAYGAYLITSTHPTSANVAADISISETLNGTALAKDAPINFGTVTPGQTYTSTLAIANTGNKALTITCSVQGLPTGWILTYTQSGTLLQPGATLQGNLILIVPSTATGNNSWTTTVAGA